MRNKIRDYKELIKMRLALLVVFSAAMGFLYAENGQINWLKFCMLLLGGFLVTASSNGFNQVMERDLDKLMTRTQARPLPDERMTSNEAIWLSLIMGSLGITILTVFNNFLCGMLSALSLVLYTLAYTPSKRITPWSVFIGAIPGAMPPMLGYVAVTNHIDFDAVVLFAIQFVWQFPHFWAIAWVLDEDYAKAGFRLLPSQGGRDKKSAFQTVVYTLGLLPIGILPYAAHKIHGFAAFIILVMGVIFLIQAIKLYKNLTIEAAKKLMFGSFIYLLVVQIALVIGRI